MDEDAYAVHVVLALVSPGRLLELLERDQHRLEMGPSLVIYGTGGGLRDGDLFLERCPDELRSYFLGDYDYRGNDTIRILGEEPTRYPEMPPRNLVRAQYGQSPSNPRYLRTGPALLRKTNNGWRR